MNIRTSLSIFVAIALAIGVMPARFAAADEARAEPITLDGDTTMREIQVIAEEAAREELPPPDVALFVTGDPALLTRDAVEILIGGGRVDGLELLTLTERPLPESTLSDLNGSVDTTIVALGVKLIKLGWFEVTLLCRWDNDTKKEVCTVDRVTW